MRCTKGSMPVIGIDLGTSKGERLSGRPTARRLRASPSEWLMRDEDCVEFLQRWLPRLQLRWSGYRKVRRTVCKRLRRRLRQLGLDELRAYAILLEQDPLEREKLDAFCRIPISRFFRDRRVFEFLGRRSLPDLARKAQARGDRIVRCWSAGCASGEEPYSLRITWAEAVEPTFPDVGIRVLATDIEPAMLRRAESACYGKGSLRDLPPQWLDRGFVRSGDFYCLRRERRQGVVFQLQDIRREMLDDPFDMILCRNLAFTYFGTHLQRDVLARLETHLPGGGFLVIGSHERLPSNGGAFTPIEEGLPIFRKADMAG